MDKLKDRDLRNKVIEIICPKSCGPLPEYHDACFCGENEKVTALLTLVSEARDEASKDLLGTLDYISRLPDSYPIGGIRSLAKAGITKVESTRVINREGRK